METFSSHLRSTVNQDGAVILDIKKGTIVTLNPTGAYIWQALERGSCEAAIVTGLAQETGIAEETIAVDVVGFIASLRQLNILPN